MCKDNTEKTCINIIVLAIQLRRLKGRALLPNTESQHGLICSR